MARRSKGPIIRPSEPEEEARAYSSPACYLHEFDSNVEPARACDVRIKRIFEEPSPADGYRVLVDRLWPRGITTARARLDAWSRTLAPSPELRKWFGHDPARFASSGGATGRSCSPTRRRLTRCVCDRQSSA